MAKYRTKEVTALANRFLDLLEKEAYRFIRDTLQYIKTGGHASGFYEHETGNLYDSYGFGIFLDGHLERKGWLPSVATAPREFRDGSVLWGREALETLFNGSNRTTSNGYVVLFAAAMPYALNLEGGIGVQKKYKVITFMEDDAWRFGESIFGKRLVKKVNMLAFGHPVND